MNQERLGYFHNNNIRIEKVVWLAAITSSPRDPLDDMIDDEQVLELVGFDPNEEVDAEELVQKAVDEKKLGFLIQVARPVRKYEKGRGQDSFKSSWGYYGTKWFYVDSLEIDLVKAAVNPWLEERERAERRTE